MQSQIKEGKHDSSAVWERQGFKQGYRTPGRARAAQGCPAVPRSLVPGDSEGGDAGLRGGSGSSTFLLTLCRSFEQRLDLLLDRKQFKQIKILICFTLLG